MFLKLKCVCNVIKKKEKEKKKPVPSIGCWFVILINFAVPWSPYVHFFFFNIIRGSGRVEYETLYSCYNHHTRSRKDDSNSKPLILRGSQPQLRSYNLTASIYMHCRKTKLGMSVLSSQIKIAGTLVSIAGAAVVFFYEGPSIIQASSTYHHIHNNGKRPLLVFVSSYATSSGKWILGCALLACATVSLTVWSSIQTSTIQRFPEMMLIVTCFILFGTVQTAVIDIVAERDLSAWKLEPNLELAIIILTAIFGTFVRSWVQAWCARIKGPKYVPLFRPFGIFWACLFGLSFFGSSLRYGNVMGAIIVGIGYYAVLWGGDKEEQEKEYGRDESGKLDSTSDMKAPLLSQEEEQV